MNKQEIKQKQWKVCTNVQGAPAWNHTYKGSVQEEKGVGDPEGIKRY